MQDNLLRQNRISMPQLVKLLILIIPGGKILTAPAYLASIAGRNSYLSYLVLFFVDFVCMLLLALAVNLNTENKSIFELFEKIITKVGAKILFSLLAVYFMVRVANLAVSCSQIFYSSVNVKANWPGYALPLAALMVVFLRYGFNSIARVSELLFFFVLTAIGAIIVFSFGRADLSNLKPFLEFGALPVFKAAAASSFWFGDALFLLFILDFVKHKGVGAKLSLGFAIGAAIAVIVDILYLSLFDALASEISAALTKISQFSVYLSIDGRFDWLTVGVWLVSVMLKMGVFCFCAYSSLRYVAGIKKTNLNYSLACAMLVPVVVLPIYIDFGVAMANFVYSIPILRYGAWVLQYGTVIAAPIIIFFATKKFKKEAAESLGEAENLKLEQQWQAQKAAEFLAVKDALAEKSPEAQVGVACGAGADSTAAKGGAKTKKHGKAGSQA